MTDKEKTNLFYKWWAARRGGQWGIASFDGDKVLEIGIGGYFELADLEVIIAKAKEIAALK